MGELNNGDQVAVVGPLFEKTQNKLQLHRPLNCRGKNIRLPNTNQTSAVKWNA